MNWKILTLGVLMPIAAIAANLPSSQPKMELRIKTQCELLLSSDRTIKIGPFTRTNSSRLSMRPASAELSTSGQNSYLFETIGPKREKFLLSLNPSGYLLSSGSPDGQVIADIYSLTLVRMDVHEPFRRQIKTTGPTAVVAEIHAYKDGRIETVYTNPENGERTVISDNSFSFSMNYVLHVGLFDKRKAELGVHIEFVRESAPNQVVLGDAQVQQLPESTGASVLDIDVPAESLVPVPIKKEE